MATAARPAASRSVRARRRVLSGAPLDRVPARTCRGRRRARGDGRGPAGRRRSPRSSGPEAADRAPARRPAAARAAGDVGRRRRPGRRAPSPVAEGGGEPVQVDGQDRRRRDPASKPRPTSSREMLVTTTCPAEAAGADQAGDDDHGQRQHDHLVDARHDRRQGERQLDPRRMWRGRGAEGVGGLDELRVDLADAQLGQPDAGRQREDDGGDDAGDHAEAEEDDARDQVDEGGHGLHEVQHRPDAPR